MSAQTGKVFFFTENIQMERDMLALTRFIVAAIELVVAVIDLWHEWLG